MAQRPGLLMAGTRLASGLGTVLSERAAARVATVLAMAVAPGR